MKKSCAINKSDIEDELRYWFSNARRVVIAGVGSSLRRDDRVGTEIVRSLRGKVPPSVCLIECETVPEDFLEPIVRFKPTHVLIIDAALLEQTPGSSKLVQPDQILGGVISTHTLPLRIFCEYLAKQTNARIALLAIQPKDTSFGEGLTKELEETAEHLSDVLLKIIKDSIQKPERSSPAEG